MGNKSMGEGSIRKNLNKKRLTAVVSAVLALVVLVAAIPVIRARADFDESTAVRFRTYKSSHTIDDSVLFIGTHLIHLDALTDELYEKAVQSQTDSGQQEVYYKSELADGLWYDITDASGLSAITSEGTPVDESELDDLYVTHYTGADGLTRDAKSGDVVCIFDDPDPYDLMKLTELEPMRRIYQDKYLEQTSDDKAFTYLRDAMNVFFAQDMKTTTTDQYDRMLQNLQKCYESFATAGMDENAQVIMTLMDGIDAARRADVFERLTEGTDELSFTDLNRMSGVVSGEYYSSKSEDSVDPFNVDTSLVEAVMDSVSQCNESYTSYNGKMLSSGGSSIQSYIYEQSVELTDRCDSVSELSADTQIIQLVNNIKYAQNIENSVVGDADAELELLNDRFVPDAQSTFTSQLKKGVSQEYQAAAKGDKSDAVKKGIIDKDKTEVEVARTGLETMITAKTDRLSASDAINYIYECITWANEQKSGIKNDDFASAAQEVVTEHIEWLTQKAQNIVNGDASLMSELDRLKALLEDYLQKQQDANDANNLELAAQYGALVEDTRAKIAAEEARLNDIINSDTSTEAEKAQAQVALGETGLLKDIDKLKQQAMKALNSGTTGDLDTALEMLGTLGGENALNQIKDALAGSNLSASDKDKYSKLVDQAIEASKESSLHDAANATADNGSGSGNGNGSGSGSGDGSGSGNGSGSGDGSGDSSGSGSGDGSGTGTGNGSGDGSGSGSGSDNGSGSGSGTTSADNPATMSEQMLLNAINEVLGGSFDELDVKGKIAAAAALDMLYDNYGNVNAKALAKQFITRCASQNNPYVYTKLSGHSETEYISLATIGNRVASSYRYVYSDSKQEATMTYGADSYRFRVGASVITLTDGTEKQIKKYKVEFQNVPYIDEATAKEYFGCEAEYIADTDYSACLTSQIKAQADDLYQTLTGQS